MAPFIFTIMIINISYSEILEVWKNDLWPGRIDIEPVSAMTYERGYSMEHFKLPVSYFGIYAGDNLIAVNSGHKCSDNSFRSRGLWVHPDHRGRGLALKLLKKTIDVGKKMNCSFSWSLPRKTSWAVYEKAGYILTSDWIKTDTSDANAYCFISYDVKDK